MTFLIGQERLIQTIEAAEIGKRMLEQDDPMSEIRSALRRVSCTQPNLKELILMVGSFAANPNMRCDGIDEVSQLLDDASDACDRLWMPSPEERAQRWMEG